MIRELQARLQARPPGLFGRQGHPAGPQRPWRLHRLDAEGRHVRCSSTHRQCWRRSALHRVLRRAECLVSAKSRSTCPGRHRLDLGPDRRSEGAERHPQLHRADDVTLDDRRRRRQGDAARHCPSARASSGACRARWSRTSSPASPTASRRRWRSPASATAPRWQGKILKLSLGYSHDVDFDVPGGRDRHDPEARPRSSSKASTSSWSARSPRTSASGASPSPTRARASVQGRVHLPQGRQEEVRGANMANSKRDLFLKRRLRVRNKLKADGGRASAAVGASVVEEHLASS